ncbi:MAG: hypothetical protein ACI4RT_02470 [Candidatus Spyradenecus sp.]
MSSRWRSRRKARLSRGKYAPCPSVNPSLCVLSAVSCRLSAIGVARTARRALRGQAIALILALLVAFAALALWVADIGLTVMGRLRTQDGGDAAALAAARWQAAGLNLCGELNFIQAYMLADDQVNAPAAQALHELRQRVGLVTPMLALQSASLVAARNGLEALPEAQSYLRMLARAVMPQGLYEGAEEELREMLERLAAHALYAFPLTAVLNTSKNPTLLAEQDFYEAILARNWCWFWFNAYSFLQHYHDHRDFGEVPELLTEPFWGLRLGETACSLESLLVLTPGLPEAMDRRAQALGHPPLPPPPPPLQAGQAPSPAQAERPMEQLPSEAYPGRAPDELLIRWTTFDEAQWGEWEAMAPGELPLAGTLKERYNYAGCNIALSVRQDATTWLAVAKPFGELAGENPTTYRLVLGGFDAVRLIPVDAGDTGVRGMDMAWIDHLRNHVTVYAERGLLADGCRYCRALLLWGNPAFRQQAIDWLALYGNTCRRPRPGGKSDTGGLRYAH